MDINYILGREQTSLYNALQAHSAPARIAHEKLAAAYGQLLADSGFPHRPIIKFRIGAAIANSKDACDSGDSNTSPNNINLSQFSNKSETLAISETALTVSDATSSKQHRQQAQVLKKAKSHWYADKEVAFGGSTEKCLESAKQAISVGERKFYLNQAAMYAYIEEQCKNDKS